MIRFVVRKPATSRLGIRLLGGCVVASACLWGAAQPAQGERIATSGQALVNQPAREAIRRGTRFLLSGQQPDGSWLSGAGKKVNEAYINFEPAHQHRLVPHVGVTALAVLSLLAGGHLPQRGPEGVALERAVGFLLSKTQGNGFIAAGGTRTYSHALATLALAEVFGVTRNARVRSKLESAVHFTVRSQNETGGWRYVPFTSDSDMSVTVCQVVALRAARNVGIRVPLRTIDRAVKYVLESAIINNWNKEPSGGFYYQPKNDDRMNRGSYALCAAALTTIFQSGIYDDKAMRRHARRLGIAPSAIPSIRRSIEFMDREYLGIARSNPEHFFYYYGSYYAAQALYQVGAQQPELWSRWYRRLRDHLLRYEHKSTDPATGLPRSHWRSRIDTTHAYATATALLILQFPLDHLPIHQR